MTGFAASRAASPLAVGLAGIVAAVALPSAYGGTLLVAGASTALGLARIRVWPAPVRTAASATVAIGCYVVLWSRAWPSWLGVVTVLLVAAVLTTGGWGRRVTSVIAVSAALLIVNPGGSVTSASATAGLGLRALVLYQNWIIVAMSSLTLFVSLVALWHLDQHPGQNS